MFKYFITGLFILLLSTSSLQATNNSDSNILLFNVIHPIYCLPKEELKNETIKHKLIFRGLLNENSLLSIYQKEDLSFFTVVESITKISCIYFFGTMGNITNTK